MPLAGCLSDQREPIGALRAYEAHRMRRSAAVTRQSALFGKIGQWEQPLLCSLRDGLTRLSLRMRKLSTRLLGLDAQERGVA